jgi:hypothetical protein
MNAWNRWVRVAALGLALVAMAVARPAGAQQILLDKPTKAGELNLYPDLNNENVYYYVTDKVHLATDASGTPQFSFMRFVKNVRSGADQAEAREGEGGGIVHALVTLSVSPEQIAAATRELQRIKPGARIQGPVAFKSGRFGLVTSLANPKGGPGVKQVVGIGNAPLLDGEKAAVSIELDKDAATKLWATFESAAPDISFHFEMDVAGFRSPKRATIEADWSKIYSHRAFGAGIATSYLAAEVKDAYDELRTTDAIKITQVGEDDKMDAIVTTAYQMIKDRMFEPFGGTGTPDIGSIAGGVQGQPSLLDRATTRLKEAQADVRATNADIRKDNDATRARNDKARTEAGKVAGDRTRAELADIAASQAEVEADVAQKRAVDALARVAELKANVKTTAVKPKAVPDAVIADAKSGDAEATPNTSGGADVAKLIAGGDFEDETVVTPQMVEQAQKRANAAKAEADSTRARATRLRREAGTLLATADQSSTAAPQAEALKKEESAPALSVIATLEMKKVKQSGTFRFDMNKYSPDNITLPFDENIGDLSRLKADPKHFLKINLDDALYKQRELVAMVDVANAQDFGQFVNFVSVQMRKKHAGGAETQDEVRVDRNNFNKEGNAFKLMYGWNGDDDRTKWMDYEVQATWSLIGGKTVVEPWKKYSSGAINLSPPYRR